MNSSRDHDHTASDLQVATSHTPGPWEVGQHPATSRGWIVRPVLFGSRTTRLPLHEGGHTILKNEADAHLIAAAPDLLAALKVVLSLFGGADPDDVEGNEALDAAVAAISKAEGK